MMKLGSALLVATQLLSSGHGELPNFPHTYDMQQSTIAMVCNYSGLLDMSGPVGKYGILDFDWSNAKLIWGNDHPMDSEAMQLQQAIRHKAANCPDECPLPHGCTKKGQCPKAKTWVYR